MSTDVLKQKLGTIVRQRNLLNRVIQRLRLELHKSCAHPIEQIVEADFSDTTGPPFRLCKLCGFTEHGWHFRVLVGPFTRIPRLSRDVVRDMRMRLNDGE